MQLQETSSILVYMTLNGKGCINSCSLHGCSLVSALYCTGQSNIAGCFGIKHFALVYNK